MQYMTYRPKIVVVAFMSNKKNKKSIESFILLKSNLPYKSHGDNYKKSIISYKLCT